MSTKIEINGKCVDFGWKANELRKVAREVGMKGRRNVNKRGLIYGILKTQMERQDLEVEIKQAKVAVELFEDVDLIDDFLEKLRSVNLNDFIISDLKWIASLLGVRSAKREKNAEVIMKKIRLVERWGARIPDRDELEEEARGLLIGRPDLCKKDQLIEKILEKRRMKKLEEKNPNNKCKHDRSFVFCRKCHEKKLCIHGKKKTHCYPCGGSQVCRHDKFTTNCYTCTEERRVAKKKERVWHVEYGEQRRGCLVPGYNDIHDFIRELNEKDD